MRSSEHPNYIVPLNLAKKLKRIGFKDKVNFYYSFHISDRGVHITGIPENMNKKYYSGKYIPLPSYEQVFSWFRERGYIVNIIYLINENLKICLGYCYEIIFNDEIKKVECCFKTYEIAREDCLRELIEIYEKKNKIQR